MLSRRQKRAIVSSAAFLLLAAVLVFSVARFLTGRALERQLAEERAALRPPQPLVIDVVRDTVERRRMFAARAEPWTRATLAPEVGGTVVRIAADVGSRVTTGAGLLALEDSTARAAAEAAEIQAAEAARRQREVDQLARTQVVATSDLAAATAAAAAAAREATRAATLLEKHVLRAPFVGTVQARQASVGDYLNPGQPAFELVDVSRLRVVFQVSDTEIASFAPGGPVEVTLMALGGRTNSAVIRRGPPASGPGGLFRVEAELPNGRGEIPGGIAVSVGAAVRLYRDTLFIPTAAVRLEGARAVVQRVRSEGPAEPVAVEIGPEIDGRFPVLRGLREGDRLLVR
jgi:membrane fusion protein, multidrug efflux system